MDRWLRCHGRTTLCIAAVLAVGLTGCEQEQTEPPSASTQSHAAAADTDASGDALSTAALAAATDPAVDQFLEPAPNAKLTYVAPGISIPATVLVKNVAPADGLFVQFYLNGAEDGAPVAITSDTVSYTFQNVSFGYHHLAAWIVDADGITLPNEESLESIKVKVVKTCSVPSDCEEGLACSNQACTSNTCNWGPKADCCDHDLECAFGYYCVSGKCRECLGDTDCDDGNPCTADQCGVDGTCFHDPLPGCCSDQDPTQTTAEQCDDGDVCTFDSCNLDTNTCVHTPSDDPLCCNVDADCKPADPCTAYMCYRDGSTGIQRCRYGPSMVNCCTDASECYDGNPCTIDTCDFADPTDDAGLCHFTEDPANALCCVSDADCDDGDLSTIDGCVDNTCVFEADPNYCALPATSPIVINEIMAAPGGVDDALGEWIELYNASPNMVDLTGFVVETDAGQSHTLVKSLAVGGSLTIFPGQYYVLARSADQTLNGGFVPHYQLNGITLPDNYEVGGDVARTVTLKDAEGTVIDSVTYDTATWPSLEDGHSWTLTHMYADNSDPAKWAVSGTHKDPAKNVKYGDSAKKLYGTPKNFNKDMYAGLDHPGCVPSASAHTCAVGKCGVDSQCFFPKEEGCCEADSDCNDYDACTIDSCDTVNNICDPPQVDELCCTSNVDCDDSNPCNLDRCIGNSCRYSPNVIDGCCVGDADCSDGDACTVDTCDDASNVCEPSVPVVLDGGAQCCNQHAECDDGDPSTDDVCDFGQSPPTCVYPSNPEYCTSVEDACDDGNLCTDDFCDVGAQQCLHTAIPGCCSKNSDCPSDDNPCTAEVCDEATGDCGSIAVAGCCIADDQCDDGNACTSDVCGAGNVCHNNAIAGCCLSADDCDDGVACTTDSCVDMACQNVQQANCCTPGDTGASLVGACGEDPDGPANCFQWECTQAGQCNLLQNDTCCTVAGDCDDGDPCTEDYCTTASVCKHVATTAGSCCIYNSDCPATDNNICTSPFCDAGTCTEAPVPGCAPPIDDTPVEPVPEDTGTDPSSCWGTDTAGYLGPDQHQQCVGAGAVVGNGAILTMSSFDPNGADDASIQFNLAWQNGAGNHNVYVMATSTQGDWTVGETLDVIPASGDNPGTQYTYELSNLMLAQNQVWIGFKVESDTPDNVDVSVDDLTVATGHAPFFVQSLQSDKTYDRTSDELLDGGTVSAKLGEVRTKVFWAHDVQWSTQALNFELIDAPDFATIDGTAKLNLYGVYQVKVGVRPNTSDDIGAYSARIRVSDGAFVATIPVQINVGLGQGYVLWAPSGDPADGTALATGLDAAGKTYQRVSDLSEVADWSLVRGLLISAGGGGTKHALSHSEVSPAVTFLDGGGDVYLEGSSTFAEDPQTSLQGYFKLAVVQQDGGVFGSMTGKSFLYPKTWEYTADASYFEDVDHVAPKQDTTARQILAHDQDGAALAIAYESPLTAGRTVASTVLVSRLAALGASPEQYITGVIDFFDNGFGGCTAHAQCDDGDACTIDECVGGQCQNNFDTQCGACQGDLDCPADQVCKADGTCQPQEGTEVGGPITDTPFNCDTTDELVQIVKSTTGFEVINDVSVRLHIELDPSQKVGTLLVTLSHNGRAVTLIEPDPTNNSTVVDTTFDAGTLPVSGSMNDFNGQFLQGDWVLTVEDTTGGKACGTVKAFDVWAVTAPAPTCTVAADCDNGQFCDGAETCAGGTCQVGTPPTCDDADACTLNQCDPSANSGAGACDNTGRVQTCAGETCSGGHAIDAGDGQCGLDDACVGGIDGGAGTCTEVCDTCSYGATGDVKTGIRDFQCVTEIIDVDTTDPYVSNVFVQVDVNHPNLSDLTVNLYSPENAKVALHDGAGSGLANFHSTFPLSNPSPAGDLCALSGVAPAGQWKVQVCDNAVGSEGTLESAAIWVGTTVTDPTIGQSCDNAIPIPVDGFTHNFGSSTECYADSTLGSCTGGDGHDIVYTLSLPTTMRVTATMQASTFDAGIYITDSCNAGSTYCADTQPAGGTETIDRLMQPGTWFLVVDSLTATGGDFTLDVKATTPKSNGQTCEENLDCESGHCQNGFCCGGGDCCAQASDCPASYTTAATCDDTTACQGHRVDPVCSSYQCGSSNVADDTACDSGVESGSCNLYDSVFCNGQAAQTQPTCPSTCNVDNDCDAGAHCFEGNDTCRVDLTNGITCGRDAHCGSGQCVDGVCCDSACDGLCQQCDKAGAVGQCTFRNNGSDPEAECNGAGLCGGTCDGAGACSFPSDTLACDTCMRCDGAGECTNPVATNTDPDDSCALCQVCDGGGACQNVPTGSDPLAECADQGASTCGQNGSCDGTGACQLYASGTVCVNQSCTAGYRDPAHTCDGTGTCVDPNDEFCDGLKCEGTGTDCLGACTQDSDCLTGYFCETGTGQCLPKSSPGEVCAADNECLSNFCTDGVCCESACAGPCRQCNLSAQEGTCVEHDAFTDPETGCGLYWCNGTGNCKNSCSGDTDCKAGNWCNGSVCEPKKDLGGACTASNQCTSGICNLEDGVCCDTACTSTCESCKLAGQEGTCNVVPSGQDPDSECFGSGATCGGTCDGAGSCQFPSSSKSCGACQRCDGAGQCLAVPANSDPDNDCGTCQTCNGSGACKNVPEGADFHDDCPTTDQSTCGTNGQCDGIAACDYYGAGTLAAAASCSAGVATLADTCNGSGGVNDGGTQSCAPYICDGVSCGSTCGAHSDCSSGFFCDFDDLDGDGRTNDCEALRPNGGQCGSGFECQAGHCANGFCCSSGLCCSKNTDCQDASLGLVVDPVCDQAAAGGCDGHRVDAFCDGNKICQTVTVDDDTACATQVCDAAGCAGLTFTTERTCDSSGGCTVGGEVLSCDDGNVCTNDYCDPAGACQHTNNNNASTSCYEGPAGTNNVGICDSGTRTCQDGNTGACVGQVLPRTETCGDSGYGPSADENCNGQVNEANAVGCQVYFKDVDDDGYGVNDYLCLCAPSGHYTATQNGDCDDSNGNAAPNKTETCSTSYDDNCNSLVNEENASGCSPFYFDGDSDGYGVGSSKCLCSASDPYDATQAGDCNDNNNTVSPGRTEQCNGYDDNCNGKTDTQERSASQMCGSIANGAPGCSAGVCYVDSCNSTYYNIDGVFSNGCEVRADSYDRNNEGESCGAPKDVDLYLTDTPAEVHDVSGNIVPAGDEDWYRVRTIDIVPWGHEFSFRIYFVGSNPGVKYQLYRDNCSTTQCSGGLTNTDIRSDEDHFTAPEYGNEWGNQGCVDDPRYNDGADHTNPWSDGWCGSYYKNCCNLNYYHGRYWYIRVYDPEGKAVGSNYTLRMSNGY